MKYEEALAYMMEDEGEIWTLLGRLLKQMGELLCFDSAWE